MSHMKAHQKCGILAHSKFMETHFGPNEPAAFCVSEIISDIIVYFCKTPAFTNFSFKMATSTILER
jgi:hypothetical protein